MVSTKKPGPLLLSTGSDEDGRKLLKNAASSEWPHKAVATLLDIYVKKFSAGRGYLRGKDWEEVMTKVNTECDGLKTLKTIKQCRDKVDSLKRRYKMEKRKAVNGNEVTWPFFDELDDMMGSVFKQARGFEPLDKQQKSSLYYSHGNDEDDEDEDDDKQGFSGSPEECHGVNSRRYFYMDHLENGKARAEERNVMSEEGLNLHRSYQAPLKLLSLTGAQISTDNSSGQGRHSQPPPLGASGKSHARKREIEPDNPMQALADALTGFSELYARVELAKMEIFTTMKLELAKLGRKRHKKHDKKDPPSASPTSS